MLKSLTSTAIVFGFLFGLSISQAEERLILDNVDLRPYAPYVFGKPTKGKGSLGLQPHYTPTKEPLLGNPIKVPLRWSGLDLEGSGTNSDYIDFTIQVVPHANSNVHWSGLGWGDSWGLSAGEGLTFSVVDVSLSSGVPGFINFEGFTSGGVQGADFKDGQYSFTVAVAGNMISGVDNSPTDKQTAGYNLPDNSFILPTLTVDNARINLGSTGEDTLTVRNFDLQFSYIKIPEPMLQ